MTDLFPIVIMSGGLATRLRPLTETIPKALLESNGKPFVHHQLTLLKSQNIKKVIMCLGFLGEQIVDYVGDGKRYGLEVDYVFDGPILLGTAGAVKKALPKVPTENFFVLNGDSYLPCDYSAVQNTFIQSEAQGLMTVFHNEGRWDTSNVEFQNNRIINYDKTLRTPRMLHIDYGLEIFNKNAFDVVPDNQPFDLVPVYQALLKNNQLAAHEVAERFYENGSLEGISALESYLKNIALEQAN
jgi:N-acetyl-alpha-D-muramate 1-phosphate uridylyltransferase